MDGSRERMMMMGCMEGGREVRPLLFALRRASNDHTLRFVVKPISMRSPEEELRLGKKCQQVLCSSQFPSLNVAIVTDVQLI